MNKTYVFVGTVIICCIFLGLGFYFGRSSYVFTDDKVELSSGDIFDKQIKCSNMYQDVKNFLKEYREYDYMSDGIGKDELGTLTVWYNKDLDSCLADASEYITYKDGDWNTTTYYSLYNINQGYMILYSCDMRDGCKDDYYREVYRYK